MIYLCKLDGFSNFCVLLSAGDTAEKSSVETKDEQQIEGMVFKESVTGPKTVPSPACVDLVENSGTHTVSFVVVAVIVMLYVYV